MPIAKKKTTPQKKTSFAPRKHKMYPIAGILACVFGLLFLVSIFDFEPSQWSQIRAASTPERNMGGVLGSELAGWSIFFFGYVAWLLPFWLIAVGYLFLTRRDSRVRGRRIIASVVCMLALAGLGQLIGGEFLQDASPPLNQPIIHVINTDQLPDPGSSFYNGLGGTTGQLIYNPWLTTNIGDFGTTLFLIAILCISFVAMICDNIGESSERAQQRLAKALKERRINRKQKADIQRAAKIEQNKLKAETLAARREERLKEKENLKNKKKDETDNETSDAAGFRFENKKETDAEPSGLKIIAEQTTEMSSHKLPEKRGEYIFPLLEFLAEPDHAHTRESPEDHQETANCLIQTLAEFGVTVTPSEVQTGPVITRYEVKPAPGVRVEKIVNLDKNIALALRAEAVRIIAPVPGKGTVGIEIPNKKPLAVRMKEIVQSKAWVDASAEIPIVLGKDVTGRPIVEDLTKMPHMLIAGATGAGKTVCINSVIASLLYHGGPDDFRFIMVDPKVVEMQVYNQLPHMLIPVVTDPKKVPGALKYLIREMEYRYQIFAKVGVRNIAGFNKKLIKDKEEKAKAAAAEREIASEMTAEERAAAAEIEVPRDLELEIPETKLPYIICIIDELADLMMVAPQDIETGVARIAQLARAAGIHLILATQRPSVNVITGVIKANLPTRISFKVASKIDSRTILDSGGAEALIGKGDMLFVPPGTHSLVRAQGAFVSDEEITAIVEFLNKSNGNPQFAESVQREIESSGEDDGDAEAGEWDDALVPDAIQVLKTSKRASTSMLQRRLKIGYNRAARIMEILEDEGYVGPENGSSPREILKDLDSL